MIRIHPISGNKKQYLDLLLLADEQESMIDRYLERGEMFILSDNDTVKASCVITCEDKGIYEIKSIAVYPEYQRQGYGRQLIAFVLEHYKDRCHTMLVGTGDSPLTIPFYESCGFAYSHRVPDFFIDNYDHPIFGRRQATERHDLSEKNASTKIISYICISLNSTHYGS